MSDLRQWLEKAKLGSLEPMLVENEIDLDVLFDLTDEDMREIGLSLGARKRLRSALEAGHAGAEASRAPSATPTSPPRGAERRHLTTLFVDLVGSTRLSAKNDPEDFSDIITRYQNTVAGIVTRYEGHVAKYMGDGVLCYFGWPVAHEDDARRAARAALDTVRKMAEMQTTDGQALAVRVGIASGVVVVGDLIGEGAAQEEAVIGDTPNLAARLQALAEPGQIIVADATKELLQADFELEELGQLDIKGLDAPQRAWAVLSERSAARRFASATFEPVLPMVGRDLELAMIMERWRRACAGEGQVMVLTGEAGIGKSRLTRAVIDEVQASDHYLISYHCSPYHTDSSFYPVISQLTHAMEIAESDTPVQALEKLRANLRAADARIIAELLQIGVDDALGPLDLTPQQVRNRIMEETAEEIYALSQDKPVLLVVEDAHWSDASTLSMLEACFNRIDRGRVMILVTARPTFTHGFGGHPIVSAIALNRLGSDQAAHVLSKITRGKRLLPELVAEIISRTDGVPLFIEELTKTILESGELRETGTSFELTGPLDRVTIPSTLHDSFMARLDRLQPIKEIAQMAACIGRSFDRSALARIARIDDEKLDDALAQLERSQVVFRRGAEPATQYVFKHALLRDVAYESLLKRRRQEIHRRLMDVFDSDPSAPPELVAHHAEEAGLVEQAVLAWAEAGTRAQARPAYVEAENHLRAAMAQIRLLRDDPGWRERELALLVQLAQIHIAKDGYASAEASNTFGRALDLIGSTDDPELKVAIYYGTWIVPYIACDLRRAFDLVSRLVEEMAEESDPIPRLISRRMRAATLIAMGRSPEALEDLEEAYRLYQSAQIVDFSSKFAQDPGVQISCYLLLALWLTGDREEARATADEALTRAHDLNHANTICYAGLHDVALSILSGEIERARLVNEEIRQLSTEHDMSLWKNFVAIHDAVIACMGDAPGAPEQLDAALEEYRATGCWLWATLYLAEQAKALLRAGHTARAEAAVHRAFREQEATGEFWLDAELHRIIAEIRLAEGDSDGARAARTAALLSARAQGAFSLEERALATGDVD